MISTRYARPLAALLALASVPVVVHSYVGLRIDDCPADSPPPVADRMNRDFAAFAADEGAFEDASTGAAFQWAVVRSFEAAKLYHHPEGGLVRGTSGPEGRSLITLPGGLPVHRVQYAEGLASYVLLYRGRPVANPYAAHLAAFPHQLVAGMRPMTLLFIYGRGPRPDVESRSAAWLQGKTEENLQCFKQN